MGVGTLWSFQIRNVCLGGEARGVGSRRGAHLPVSATECVLRW